ncbi:hypothetical protein [Ilumatobacter sp.]|uniref:hypothetical protein n=1 Tax=Ilumatobacter sp. TaxID=1967498 RepID=UPI0037506D82
MPNASKALDIRGRELAGDPSEIGTFRTVDVLQIARPDSGGSDDMAALSATARGTVRGSDDGSSGRH